VVNLNLTFIRPRLIFFNDLLEVKFELGGKAILRGKKGATVKFGLQEEAKLLDFFSFK